MRDKAEERSAEGDSNMLLCCFSISVGEKWKKQEIAEPMHANKANLSISL